MVYRRVLSYEHHLSTTNLASLFIGVNLLLKLISFSLQSFGLQGRS